MGQCVKCASHRLAKQYGYTTRYVGLIYESAIGIFGKDNAEAKTVDALKAGRTGVVDPRELLALLPLLKP